MSAPFDIIAFAAEAGIELPELPEAALQPPEIAITASQRHDSEAARGVASPAFIVPEQYKDIPLELRELPNWVNYLLVPKMKDGKPAFKANGVQKFDKIPYNPSYPFESKRKAASNDPQTWDSFEQAVINAKTGFSGVGFMFGTPSKKSGFVGGDFDDCLAGGKILPWAKAVLDQAKAYTEYSRSGNGVHFICGGELPAGTHIGSAELYDCGRFFAFTGKRLTEYPATCNERREFVKSLYHRIHAHEFDFSEKETAPSAELAFTPSPQTATRKSSVIYSPENLSDEQKIEIFTKGKFVFENPRIVEHVTENGVKHSAEAKSQSELDLSLLTFLVRKHRGDTERADEDFRASILYREKWERADYRKRTFKPALESYREWEATRVPMHGAAKTPNAAPATMPESSLLLVRGSEIKPEHQEWLWKNRFPANTLTNIVGEPDKGKGVVSADLVARLTKGRDFPDGQKNPFGKPVEVLMFIAEDSLKSTVIPRLMQAGADVSKVIFLDSVLLQDGEKKIKRQLALDTDLPMIKKALAQNPQIRVGVVDTITSYMGNANQYRDSEMRKILLPFRDLAEEMHVTFVTIAHFNKTVQASAMNRTGGSIALTAVPRAVWCCTVDPDEEGQYLFLQIKGNLGKKLKGLSYRIEDAVVDIGTSQPAEVPKLVWGIDGVDKTADDVLVKSADPKERGITKAEKFLQDVLADGLPHLSKEVFDAGFEDGISSDNIKKARRNIGIQTKNIAMQWYSRLPTDANNKGRAPWVIVPKTVDVQGDKLTA